MQFRKEYTNGLILAKRLTSVVNYFVVIYCLLIYDLSCVPYLQMRSMPTYDLILFHIHSDFCPLPDFIRNKLL